MPSSAASSPPRPSRLPPPDARLALAALLVRVARADGAHAASEVSRIDAVLRSRFGSRSLRRGFRSGARPRRIEEEAPDTVRFTRALKDAVAYEDPRGA